MSENLGNAGGTSTRGKPSEEKGEGEKERNRESNSVASARFDDIRDEKHTERFTSG